MQQTAQELEVLSPALTEIRVQSEALIPPAGSALTPYLQIARVDHWVKNLFMLLGVLLAFFIKPELSSANFLFELAFAFCAVGLVASSNYVINEILDGEFDKFHPDKRHRPIPAGLVRIELAYAEWLLLAAAGLTALFSINSAMGFSG